MPKGILTSQSDIKNHLEQFKLSTQSVSEYCRNHNIPSSTFHGWKKRYNKSNKSLSKLTKKDFLTVPVSPIESKTSSETGTIKFSHTSVELYGDVSISLLHGILETLKSHRIIQQ